jgi:hypothetical protein
MKKELKWFSVIYYYYKSKFKDVKLTSFAIAWDNSFTPSGPMLFPLDKKIK